MRKHPSHLGMQLKDPVYTNLCTLHVGLSYPGAVAARAVSLLRCQNGGDLGGERGRKR